MKKNERTSPEPNAAVPLMAARICLLLLLVVAGFTAAPAIASDDPPCTVGSTAGTTTCPQTPAPGVLNAYVELERWVFPGAHPAACRVRVHLINIGPGPAHPRPWTVGVVAPGGWSGAWIEGVLADGTTPPLAPGAYQMFETLIEPDPSGSLHEASQSAALLDGIVHIALDIDGPTRATDTYVEIDPVGRSGYCAHAFHFTDGPAPDLPPVP